MTNRELAAELLDTYREKVVTQLTASRYGSLAESKDVQKAWREEKAAYQAVLAALRDAERLKELEVWCMKLREYQRSGKRSQSTMSKALRDDIDAYFERTKV